MFGKRNHGGPAAQLAHIWAQQKKTCYAKKGNVIMDGTKIYSYGYHFCIANFIKKNVVLFNSHTYSPTTSHHQAYVKSAIPETVKVFYVPDTGGDHARNMEYYLLKIRNLLYDASKSRTQTSSLLGQAWGAKELATQYSKLFKCGHTKVHREIKKIDVRPAELEARAAIQHERAEIIRLKEVEKAKVVMAEAYAAVPLWQSGINPEKVNLWSLPEAFLRLGANGEEIETSKGARVPLREGKILLDMIRAGKDIKGHEIGHFTVISINGVLKVGCHEIPRGEIDRFAISQGW